MHVHNGKIYYCQINVCGYNANFTGLWGCYFIPLLTKSLGCKFMSKGE